MKLKRLLHEVEAFLSAEERERRRKKAQMREVLDKLKKKERKLEDAIAAEEDVEARTRLEGRLKVVHAQRRKGVAALKALKSHGKATAGPAPVKPPVPPAGPDPTSDGNAAGT